ncbi:MAG: SRPBCC domain-containing protein [Chloroflexi bacterium]|nr:SRPBCC domain-containing protein [Chloroflexota bacterium]
MAQDKLKQDPIESDIVERKIRIEARPETVFAFFIDPQKMVRWKGIQANLSPVPGGEYRVNLNGRDIVRGKYLEIVPFSRVVFTWGWEGEGHPLPPGASTVEIVLIPDGNGTIVHLRHIGLARELRQIHAAGWDHYLPRLIASAAGRDPGEDPWVVTGQMGP